MKLNLLVSGVAADALFVLEGDGNGGNLGATIRSIDVNGQRLDLQNDAPA